MSAIQNIQSQARQKSKPSQVSPTAWANAVNWNIEVWKCYLKGQTWTHELEICCKEQYEMLLNKEGRLILPNVRMVRFKDNVANKEWVKQLTVQITDMRDKGEWNESLVWSRLLARIVIFQKPTPNEEGLKKGKLKVKGHKLIRIKTAA